MTAAPLDAYRRDVRTALICLVLATACDSGLPPVYVDATAVSGGDGSRDRPFKNLADGLAGAPGDAEIVIAAGVYDLPSPWEFTGRKLLRGAGDTGTVLRTDAVVDWSAHGRVALRGLSIAARLRATGGSWTFTDVAFPGGNLAVIDAIVSLDEARFAAAVGPCLWLERTLGALSNVSVTQIVADENVALYGADAMVALDSDVRLRDLDIDATSRGIVLKRSTAYLGDSRLANGDSALLLLQEDSAVEAERLQTTGGHIGVLASASELTLRQSTVSGATYIGLIGSDQSSLTIQDSTFSDNGDSHVALLGMAVEATLENNDLRNAGGGCVAITYSRRPVLLRANVVSGCVGAGIGVQDANATILLGNTIEDITPDPVFDLADAITLIDADVTIDSNTIRAAAGKGINAIRSQVIAIGNTLSELGEPGVSLMDPGTSTSIVRGNTITAASGAGIVVLNATAEIRDNTVANTAYLASYGLGEGVTFAEGADVVVDGNTLRDNSRNGVSFMAPAYGVVRLNDLQDNAFYGVREFCVAASTSDVELSDNSYTNNAYGDALTCANTP